MGFASKTVLQLPIVRSPHSDVCIGAGGGQLNIVAGYPVLQFEAGFSASTHCTLPADPAVIALQQARLLYPDQPVDVLVSLGCGQAPPEPRGGKSIIDTGV